MDQTALSHFWEKHPSLKREYVELLTKKKQIDPCDLMDSMDWRVFVYGWFIGHGIKVSTSHDLSLILIRVED